MDTSFARVQSGIEGIASTSEKLNHREWHRGHGGERYGELGGWHSRFYLEGGQSTIFVKTGIESCLETGLVQTGVGQ
jgi:hypothetical protein